MSTRSPSPGSGPAIALAASLAMTVATAAPAAAQSASEPAGFSYALTPYLWVAGIDGSVTTPFQRLPQREVDVSFGDTLSDLSGFAFMGAAEVRHGRFGLLADAMTLTVESDISTRGVLFAGGTGRVRTTTGSLIGLFRVVDQPAHAVDVGLGLRPWTVATKLSLDPGLLAGRIQKTDFTWTDPVLALRYATRFNESWGATLYGDLAGFGAGSEISWQLLGTLDYHYSDRISLRVGYRHLQLVHQRLGTDIDIGLSGPIIGSTIRF